jgi:hypothetical protein
MIVSWFFDFFLGLIVLLPYAFFIAYASNLLPFYTSFLMILGSVRLPFEYND